MKINIENIFKYKEKNFSDFILPQTNNNINELPSKDFFVSKSLNDNLEYLNTKYNMIINSDIKTRDFKITVQGKEFNSFIIYIDGMVSNQDINNYILNPLLLKNEITMDSEKSLIKSQILSKTINIKDFIYSCIIPQNSISCESKFSEIIPKINSGFCVLFVDSIDNCFCIESKGYKFRDINEPSSESVVKGSHEGFVENLRTNTSLIRKIINNENLIIEEIKVRKNKSNFCCCMLYG